MSCDVDRECCQQYTCCIILFPLGTLSIPLVRPCSLIILFYLHSHNHCAKYCPEKNPKCFPEQSWWVYESRAYTGSNMLSRITEAALATMVLAVVNQHHARLYTPLQVCVCVCVILATVWIICRLVEAFSSWGC